MTAAVPRALSAAVFDEEIVDHLVHKVELGLSRFVDSAPHAPLKGAV